MDTARTSLVAHLISPMRAITTTPVGFMRVIRFSPHKQRPSPLLWRVGTYDDVSRPAQCSLTLWPAWPTDLLKRPFLEVLQHIRYLLHRSKCFRPKRKKNAGSDLHRRIKRTLARHTQQPSGKRHSSHCAGQKELAVCRIGTRRSASGGDSNPAGHRQTQRTRSSCLVERHPGKTPHLAQQSHRRITAVQ